MASRTTASLFRTTVAGFMALVGVAVHGQTAAPGSASYYAVPPYPPFPGARLNDASTCGGPSNTKQNATYTVVISSNGSPDSFQWKKENGALAPAVGITGACQILSDGVGIQFAHQSGHTVGDQWVFSVGTGAKSRDLLESSDFGVDPSGRTDSTAGLQAGINQSRVSGQCLILNAGVYKLTGSGLLMNGGQCIAGAGTSQAILLNAEDNMTAITVEGYHNQIRGLLITKAKGLKGGTGILVTTNASVGKGNTENNQIADVWIVADDPFYNQLKAGVLIQGNAAGEVVYTEGYRVHVQGAMDAWEDSTSPAEIGAGFQNNANWCTDCNLENSARCLHLNGVGEDHFDGLSLNGCNGIPSTGTISVVHGSTAVVGTGTNWKAPGTGNVDGAPLYVQGSTATITGQPTDATHLTLSAPFEGVTATNVRYGIGEAPIVIDSTPYGNGKHAPSAGNLIVWNTGEPVQTVAIFDPFTERNNFTTPNVAPLGASVYDMTNGKNMVLSSGGNFLPNYDANGFAQLWIGQVGEHIFQQYATFQITETSPAGRPGAGNNDIMRIQKASSPQVEAPMGSAWLDFNPYANGFYLATAASYRGSTLKLDTQRADAYLSGSVDFMHDGHAWANLAAVVPNSAYASTELHLSTVPGTGGAPTDQGAIATRIRNKQSLSLGSVSSGTCASATLALSGAVPGDSVSPAWPADVFAPGVVGSMLVSAADKITVNVCNFSGRAINGNALYGAVVVR